MHEEEDMVREGDSEKAATVKVSTTSTSWADGGARHNIGGTMIGRRVGRRVGGRGLFGGAFNGH